MVVFHLLRVLGGVAQVGLSILPVATDCRPVCVIMCAAIGTECRLASSIGLTMAGICHS